MTCNLKTEARGGGGGSGATSRGDIVAFKVILGSFGACISKWPLTLKRLSLERNGLRFETHGHIE